MRIFDSLTHPTLNGQWLGRSGLDSSFESLKTSLRVNDYLGACAVSVPNDPSLCHEAFIKQCRTANNLFPVGAITKLEKGPMREEMDCLVDLGYRAVKVHPRYLGVGADDPRIASIFWEAVRRRMVIFYCTYQSVAAESYPTVDPLAALVVHLQALGDSPYKIILMHGGGIDVLRHSELVRHTPNRLLLDLSFTMMKYEGSSVDQDIRFLFQSFDRRICIGSDHPEWSQEDVRRRASDFSAGLDREKIDRIGHLNLMHFIGIE